MFNVTIPKEEVLAIRRRMGKTQREMSYILNTTERAYRRWETQTGAKGVAAAALLALEVEAEAA